MIQEIITDHCPQCGSVNLVKNGHNKPGSQQAHCQDCDAYFVLAPKSNSPSPAAPKILKTALERWSLRGLEGIFEVSRQTIARWIKALPPFRDSILPARPNDVLELDEAWSFVKTKTQKRWLWTAVCRRTRQMIAYVIGDHSDATCKRLWKRAPVITCLQNGLSLSTIYYLLFDHYRKRFVQWNYDTISFMVFFLSFLTSGISGCISTKNGMNIVL